MQPRGLISLLFLVVFAFLFFHISAVHSGRSLFFIGMSFLQQISNNDHCGLIVTEHPPCIPFADLLPARTVYPFVKSGLICLSCLSFLSARRIYFRSAAFEGLSEG